MLRRHSSLLLATAAASARRTAVACPICVKHAVLRAQPPAALPNRPPLLPSTPSAAEAPAPLAVPRFATARDLQLHLRIQHPLALGLCSASGRAPTTKRKRRRFAAASLLRVAPQGGAVSCNGRAFRIALECIANPLHRAGGATFPTTRDNDAMSLLARWLLGADAGRDPASVKNVVFVDLANVRDACFTALSEIDPGAEALLLSAQTRICIVEEPRGRDVLPQLAAARNVWLRGLVDAGRVCTIRCRRGRELGDLVHTDILSRCLHHRQQQGQEEVDGQLRVFVITNDLRHRRGLQDIAKKCGDRVVVLGVHAFANDDAGWREAATEMMRHIVAR